MSGYQEVFTDPSYFGQLMVTTNAHIGNYGVHSDEIESEGIKISGLICKNLNKGFSRTSADNDLTSYFLNENKIIISDVDTRAVVRHIRDKGAMNAIISTANIDLEYLTEELAKVPSMEGLELSSSVSTIGSLATLISSFTALCPAWIIFFFVSLTFIFNSYKIT